MVAEGDLIGSCEIEKRLNPLIERIERLERERNVVVGNELNVKQSFFGSFDDNFDDLQEEKPIPISMPEQDSLSKYRPTNNVKGKRSLEQIVKRQSPSEDIPIQKLAHSTSLDEIIVSPEHYQEWTALCARAKRLFKQQAQCGKLWTDSEKTFLVKFIEFGIQKVGIRKEDMVSLARISESSFKRWKRI